MSLREHHERRPANYWVDAGRTGKDQKARVLHEPQFFTRCAKREQRSSSQNAELENIPIKSLNDFLCKEPRATWPTLSGRPICPGYPAAFLRSLDARVRSAPADNDNANRSMRAMPAG